MKCIIFSLAVILMSASLSYSTTQDDEAIDKEIGILTETWHTAPPSSQQPQTPPSDPHSQLGQPFFQQPSGSGRLPSGSPTHG